MMKCLVTGVAGFIGSHLAEKLIEQAHHVLGVDCFTDYYAKEIKQQNIDNLLKSRNFTFVHQDILDLDLADILEGADVIFHLAAQAGVRTSWGQNFEIYAKNNILATQCLLEAVKERNIKKFVFASSSSVYGDTDDLPMKETSLPKPISPYGVSKLAAEHLCRLYWKNFNVPAISLRYFSVFGSRQRPDMAFHKFIKAILAGEEIVIYGDGKQTRDFTYISDIVEANILAMRSNVVGETFNIGGGARVQLSSVIQILEDILNTKARVKFDVVQKGDVKHTFADISKAEEMLGYEPKVALTEGLRQQVKWMEWFLQR
jgi:UDP-glucose 4-epimerase